MRFLVVVIVMVAAVAAKPGYLHPGLVGVTHVAGPTYAYSAPATITYSAPAPAAVVAPVSISSQYHAQDELGQYSYGYHGGLSAKTETRAFDGSVAGGYSYVDANGVVQSAHYIADPVNGFRVAATNLPVAPEAPAAPELEAPKPVEDTPEVAEAKAKHAAAVAEAAARAAAAPDVPEPEPVTALAAPVAPAAAVRLAAVPAPLAYHAGVIPSRSFAYHTVAAAPAYAYGYNHLAYSAPVVHIAPETLPAEALEHLRAKAALLG